MADSNPFKTVSCRVAWQDGRNFANGLLADKKPVTDLGDASVRAGYAQEPEKNAFIVGALDAAGLL
jgi:hypothetical protein